MTSPYTQVCIFILITSKIQVEQCLFVYTYIRVKHKISKLFQEIAKQTMVLSYFLSSNYIYIKLIIQLTSNAIIIADNLCHLKVITGLQPSIVCRLYSLQSYTDQRVLKFENKSGAEWFYRYRNPSNNFIYILQYPRKKEKNAYW